MLVVAPLSQIPNPEKMVGQERGHRKGIKSIRHWHLIEHACPSETTEGECELSDRAVPVPRDGQSRPRWPDWLQMKQRVVPFDSTPIRSVGSSSEHSHSPSRRCRQDIQRTSHRRNVRGFS